MANIKKWYNKNYPSTHKFPKGEKGEKEFSVVDHYINSGKKQKSISYGEISELHGLVRNHGKKSHLKVLNKAKGEGMYTSPTGSRHRIGSQKHKYWEGLKKHADDLNKHGLPGD